VILNALIGIESALHPRRNDGEYKNMQVQNARRWAPRGKQRWLAAAAALTIASAVRLLLHPLLGPIMPGTAFCIAAVLVEYYFGLAPALTVMLAGLGIADFLFVPPYATIDVFNRSDLLFLISYPHVALVRITLLESLRRAQFRAELIASVAQSRYEMLLRNDNERALARRAVDETRRLLHHLSHHHKTFVLIQALERKPARHPAASDAPAHPGLSADIAPGPRFTDVDPDDVRRLSNALWPGSHRVRLVSEGAMRLVDCICERFTTHAGDFLVLRIGDEA
jgi:K+-sensing histidine kinase KdpD